MVVGHIKARNTRRNRLSGLPVRGDSLPKGENFHVFVQTTHHLHRLRWNFASCFCFYFVKLVKYCVCQCFN